MVGHSAPVRRGTDPREVSGWDARSAGRLALAGLALLMMAAAACTGTQPAAPPPPTTVVTPPPTATPVPATPVPATPAPSEDPAPETSADDDIREGEYVVADRPLPGFQRIVMWRWAAITDQRRDVLDLGYGDVVRIVRGDARDWSAFGGSPQPIRVYLPESQASAIAEALGIVPGAWVADLLPASELTQRVASTPGAFALLAPERLDLGVLALTVGGHDPYRDPAWRSPLRLVRWIGAATADDAGDAVSESELPTPFDPAGCWSPASCCPCAAPTSCSPSSTTTGRCSMASGRRSPPPTSPSRRSIPR